MPPAADDIVHDAFAARLGIVRNGTAPDPKALPTDEAAEVFKRTKEFLGHLPKNDRSGGGLPQWFQDWKVAVDEEKEKEKAVVEAAAKEEAYTQQKKKEAKEKADADGVAAALAEATSDAASAMGDGMPAIVTATGVVGQFENGQRVTCPGKRGKPRLVGVVEQNHLAKHCWVYLDQGQGVESGMRKNILTVNLQAITAQPSAEGNGSPAIGGTPEDAEVVDETVAEEQAWEAAVNVF